MTACSIIDCPRRMADGHCELTEEKIPVGDRLKSTMDCSHKKFKERKDA